MRLCQLLFIVAALGTGIAARADEGRDHSLAKVCAGVLKSAPADPQKLFAPRLQAQSRNGPLPDDLVITRTIGGQTRPEPLDADHSFALHCEQPGATEASVHVNYPKSRVGFGIIFPARAVPGTTMSYAALTESVPVMKEAIHLQAGVLTMLAPSVVSLKVALSPGGWVSVALPDGAKKFAADAAGNATVPWNPAWASAQVTLSAPMRAITPQLSR
jgi:hypothetical protein